MVVAKLEAFQKIPISKDIKAYITSFIENPGTAEQLAKHLQSVYQDTESFNYALYNAIKNLQIHIVEERNKEAEGKSEYLSVWESVSYNLQENFLNDIIQFEIEKFSHLMSENQIDINTLKEMICFEGDIIRIIPSLIDAKEIIDLVLDKASNEIGKLEYLQTLLFHIRHHKKAFDRIVSEVLHLEIVPFIQLYDEYSFNLGEIKRMLIHYQTSIYSKSYAKLTAPEIGNTFMWDGTQGQLKKLFDTLNTQYISLETSFETFRLLFSATSMERIKDKIIWIHSNVKNEQPNRLSLKSLIYALSREGFISRRYQTNSRITYHVLEECFLNVRKEPFREFRKSTVDFRTGSSKEMLDLVKSIK